jgi:hypothetical protein
MDSFDYKDTPVQPPKSNPALVWNVLTALALLATILTGAVYALLFLNPQTGFNPFPPEPLPAEVTFPTVTPTPRIVLPPTWTPTASPEPTSTETPAPTEPLPTETPAVEESPTPLVEITPTRSGEMPYAVQQGNPVAILNFAHQDLGCNWTGVAGQALSLNGAPVVGLLVQLRGTWAGSPVDLLGMTGTATQYGAGGYEFTLGDQPAVSNGRLWVQLFDQAMTPLSDQVPFDTFADCEKNLVHINFKQTR